MRSLNRIFECLLTRSVALKFKKEMNNYEIIKNFIIYNKRKSSGTTVETKKIKEYSRDRPQILDLVDHVEGLNPSVGGNDSMNGTNHNTNNNTSRGCGYLRRREELSELKQIVEKRNKGNAGHNKGTYRLEGREHGEDIMEEKRGEFQKNQMDRIKEDGAHSYRYEEENISDEEEEKQYLTYCDDGYLRSVLKNAVISSSLRVFLGTKVISFLNEEERCICSLTCKLLFFEVYSLSNLKNLYKNRFISNEKRSFVWKAILLADNTYMSEEAYTKLNNINSSYEKIIEKDIDRTFPRNPSFLNKEENMQNKLLDILKICSLYFKRIGYCQGMNYVAAIFLLVFQNKLDTVRCFIALLKNFNLKGMFIYNFPQLKKIMYQLNILIKAYIPKLFSYFKRKKIKIDFFCTNWFMTLFSQDLSFENTLKLWDIFFLFGLKILIKLSLAILHHHQKQILTLSYDEALTFLKSITKLPFTNYLFDEKNFFIYIKKFKVTNRILRQIILLKKNHEKVEIQVKKSYDKVRCSLLLRTSSKERQNTDKLKDAPSDNFMDKFMDMFKGSNYNAFNSNSRRNNCVNIAAYNGGIPKERSCKNVSCTSYYNSYNMHPLNCANFFHDSTYLNDFMIDSQCLSLNFNNNILCGNSEKIKYRKKYTFQGDKHNYSGKHNSNDSSRHNSNRSDRNNSNRSDRHNSNRSGRHNSNCSSRHNSNDSCGHNSNDSGGHNSNDSGGHNSNDSSGHNCNRSNHSSNSNMEEQIAAKREDDNAFMETNTYYDFNLTK
ncbi:GTPase-activating protein, putative [Plasmodium malariae]|uniref:GTPase-activating protein, putative n=1 Tax=Plasmodium malariae TaxID=5858 RepID=A0A1A8W155_PLAMA|nr:GTPase-activating protein, putative [Plasmodium malariae]